MAPPIRRVALAHLVALAAGLIVVLSDAAPDVALTDVGLELVIVVAFAALRIVSVRRRLAISTLVLDAAATVLLLAGTGAPASAWFFIAVAGAWWAAHVPRDRGGVAWSAAFAFTYLALVVPGAVRDRLLVHALEDVSVVVIIGVLSAWFVHVDARAIALSEALARAPAGAEKLAIHEGLKRALGPVEISVDVLLAAGRSGLTVVQAELLAYLALGLTNQEIADATSVGEATVRYRLTRLYRALGIRGRKAAVRRAIDLGIASDERGPANGSQPH
jgi:LuxR family maltose regulon positive regulatory protein